MIEKDYLFFLSSNNKSFITIETGDKIINEVEMETSHNNIYEDSNNNIYFVNYRTNKIIAMDKRYKVDKIFNINNNGRILIDPQHGKLYVCDTEEVCIYGLQNGQKSGAISGFIAANWIEMDRSKKSIYILDTIAKKLKVFDTSNLKLISKYENIGTSPSKFCIGEKAKYIYIANKGGLTERYKSYIFRVDIIGGKNSKIDFEKGTILASMELCGKFLYVMNHGLQRVEVIDVLNFQKIRKLKTSFEEPKMFCLSPDKKILLSVSKSISNKIAVDVVDTDTNIIIDTFFPKFIDEKYLYIATITREKKQFMAIEKSTSRDNKVFEINDMKNYFEKMFVQFEKMRLSKIEVEKQLAWQKEKTEYYKKNNETLKEQNNYYKKKLFQVDKEKIIIQRKLDEKTRIINNQEKNNKHDKTSK